MERSVANDDIHVTETRRTKMFIQSADLPINFNLVHKHYRLGWVFHLSGVYPKIQRRYGGYSKRRYGGYSKHLKVNIEKLFIEKVEVMNIIRNMQKSVISSEAHLSRVFKMRTKFSGLLNVICVRFLFPYRCLVTSWGAFL